MIYYALNWDREVGDLTYFLNVLLAEIIGLWLWTI